MEGGHHAVLLLRPRDLPVSLPLAEKGVRRRRATTATSSSARTRSPPSASARTWSARSATGAWPQASWRKTAGSGAEAVDLGELLLADDGLDPYLEDPATLWLLHWQIASNRSRATTWFWTFSHFHEPEFTREALTSALFKWTQTLGGKKVAAELC